MAGKHHVLLAIYTQVQSAFLFTNFWRCLSSSKEVTSVRRPAAYVRKFRPFSNGFSQCIVSLAQEKGPPSVLRFSLHGASLDRVKVDELSHPLTWPCEAKRLTTIPFPDAPALEISCTFTSNPYGEQYVTILSAHSLTVYQVCRADKTAPLQTGFYADDHIAIHQRFTITVDSAEFIIDAALHPWRSGFLALLTSKNNLTVYDIRTSRNLTPIKTIDLNQWTQSLANERGVNVSEFHTSLPQGACSYARLRGSYLAASEEFSCIEWSASTRHIFIAGKCLYCLDLESGVMTVKFPMFGSVYKKEMEALSDESPPEDFGFTALALHPVHRTVLAAVSATTHTVMLFDITQRPLYPLLNLPLKDEYKVSVLNKRALWISQTLVEFTEAAWRSSPEQPIIKGGSSYLILSAPTTFQDSLRTESTVFEFSNVLIHPRTTPPSHIGHPVDHYSPFNFCLYSFCPWVEGAHPPDAGGLRLEESAQLSKKLLRNTKISFIESNVKDVSKQIRKELRLLDDSIDTGDLGDDDFLQSTHVLDDLANTVAPLNEDDRATTNNPPAEDLSAAVCDDLSTVCSLGLLDARLITKHLESWEPSNVNGLVRDSHFLALPRPPCACGLRTLSSVYQYRFPPMQPFDPDMIGPTGRLCTYTHPPLTVHGKNRTTMHSFYAVSDYKVLLRQPYVMRNANDIEADQFRSSSSTKVCDWEMELCCMKKLHMIKRSPLDQLDIPKVKAKLKPIGVKITKKLINFLESDWPGNGGESPTDKEEKTDFSVYPMWLNVDRAESRIKTAAQQQETILQQLESAQRRLESRSYNSQFQVEMDSLLDD